MGKCETEIAAWKTCLFRRDLCIVLLAPHKTRRFERRKEGDDEQATPVARGGDSILHLRCAGGFEHWEQVDNTYTACTITASAGRPVDSVCLCLSPCLSLPVSVSVSFYLCLSVSYIIYIYYRWAWRVTFQTTINIVFLLSFCFIRLVLVFAKPVACGLWPFSWP